MGKIWLIIKREYLTRVRNKTFILSTILLPLFFIGFIAASTYLSMKSQDKQTIAVNDGNGIFKDNFKSDEVVAMISQLTLMLRIIKQKDIQHF